MTVPSFQSVTSAASFAATAVKLGNPAAQATMTALTSKTELARVAEQPLGTLTKSALATTPSTIPSR